MRALRHAAEFPFFVFRAVGVGIALAGILLMQGCDAVLEKIK